MTTPAAILNSLNPNNQSEAELGSDLADTTTTDMDNYRPISVLLVVSKVLESVVHHQLHSFLSEHKLLRPCLPPY